MRKAILSIVFSVFCAGLAFGQGSIQQAGPVVPLHVPAWFQNGVQGDAGAASGLSSSGSAAPGLSEILKEVHGTGTPPFANAGSGPFGTNDCNYDGPVTNATGYHYLCFSPNALGGGLIAYGAVGSAAQLPLYMDINGTIYQFPFVLSGVVGPSTTIQGDLACWNNTVGTLLSDCGQSPNALRVVGSGSSDPATTSDVTIAWNSGSALAKTETLYACGASTNSRIIYIKDAAGTARLYPISVTPAGGNTIDGSPIFIMAFPYQAIKLQCLGTAGQWMVL